METAQPTNLGLESAKGSTKNKVIASIGGFLAIGGSISPSFAESSPTQDPVSITANTESLASAALVAKTKKNKLSCKKINKIRKKGIRPLKKKEKKYLKNKCGIKYPNIIGSTKNTKISGGIAYNWGPAPTDTGVQITKNGYDAQDETYFDYNYLLQTRFNSTGQPLSQKAIGSNSYYRFNSGDSTEVYSFDQPLPSRNPDSYDYGTVLDFSAVNLSDKNRSLNISLKDYPSYQNTFVESSINLLPGESADIIIADSPNQPLNMLGHQGVTGNQIGDNNGLYILSPDNEKASSLRPISRAVLKICVISDIPHEHCYTRAVVTGKSSIFD
jgi:hypothetical protein